MKKLLFALMIVAILACPVIGASLRQHQIAIVDEFGEPVTNITSITIYNTGLGTSPTIYSDRAGTLTMTNPITTSSTNSTFVQSLGLVTWFQKAPTYKVTLTDGSKSLTIDSRNESDTRFPWYDNYIGSLSSYDLGDNDDLDFGTDTDVVGTWENSNDILSWIPAVDGTAFDIGDSGTAKNMNFNVYVGTLLGLKIDEGVPSFTWDGGAVTLNHNSNFNVGICSGTSTGATTIGSSTAGAIIVDSTSTVTMNSDGAFSVTTTDAGADITINSILGRVIIEGEEDTAEAVLITADGGTASTLKLHNDTGTAATSIYLLSDLGGITGVTSAGAIVLTATGATAGDMTFTVGDDYKLIVTGEAFYGIDATGFDSTWYGDTASSNMKWDEDGDTNGSLILTGVSQTITGIDSGGNLLTVAGIDTTGNSDTVVITHSGTGAAIKATSLEADTQLLELVSAANQTTWLGVIDGATGNWIGADNVGMLHLKADTALAHAGASQLMVTNTAQPITAAEGFLARFIDTGTARTNAYAVEIEVTDTTGGLHSTGHATFDKGCQVISQSVTATADGLTTGLIPDHASFVTVTSDAATKVVVLPTWVIGHVIRITVPSTGAELQTLASSNDTINAVDCDGTNEMAMAAASVYHLECVADSKWIAYAWGSDGAAQATIVPDAD